MFKPIIGNSNYIISLNGEIRKSNGDKPDLNIFNNNVTISLYFIERIVDIQWLALLSHFEADLPEHLDNIYFTDINPVIVKSNCGKCMQFNKPILVNSKYRIIPNYTGYAASRSGEILDVKTGKILPISERKNKFYLSVHVYDPDKGIRKSVFVHRLVALAWIPNKDFISKSIVNHINGNKHHNHYTNLEWCSFRQNILHAVDEGLRNDNRRYKVKNIETGEVVEYPSFSQLCESLGINKTIKFKDTYSIKKGMHLIKGKYEVKKLDDDSEWKSDFGELMEIGKYTVTVTYPNGDTEVFNKISDICDRLSLPSDNHDIKKTIKRAENKFPGIKFNVVLNTSNREVQAYKIDTGETFEANGIHALGRLLNIGFSTIRAALKISETHNCKGYAFRYKSENPWNVNFTISQYSPIAVMAKNISNGEIIEFKSIKKAAEYFVKDKSTIKSYIKTGKLLDGWMLTFLN